MRNIHWEPNAFHTQYFSEIYYSRTRCHTMARQIWIAYNILNGLNKSEWEPDREERRFFPLSQQFFANRRLHHTYLLTCCCCCFSLIWTSVVSNFKTAFDMRAWLCVDVNEGSVIGTQYGRTPKKETEKERGREEKKRESHRWKERMKHRKRNICFLQRKGIEWNDE